MKTKETYIEISKDDIEVINTILNNINEEEFYDDVLEMLKMEEVIDTSEHTIIFQILQLEDDTVEVYVEFFEDEETDTDTIFNILNISEAV